MKAVHSKEENDFLNTLAMGSNYWIGGYPRGSEWVWSDLSEFDYDHYYSTREGHCLYQNGNNYGNGWSTDDCAYDAHYFTCILM